MTKFRVIALDDIEAIPGPGTLTWRPVRATLGLRAFGTNAYTAAEAGEDVVEPHTEESAGHQELYLVFPVMARDRGGMDILRRRAVRQALDRGPRDAVRRQLLGQRLLAGRRFGRGRALLHPGSRSRLVGLVGHGSSLPE